ncbi:phosphopentomutase [Anoxynatronum buryatiense]|uniref:phosphopentomutase n=1 Tax=Anoxynatronum buryatiense TaxID=489973 RepID=UPI0024B66832|nr:phosphopentomutase [Anoxynatronum buryatiense]
MNRVILLILDSVGIGALPDAHDFGDVGANTLGNIIKSTGGIALPHMQALGLGNIEGIEGIDAVTLPQGAYGRSAEISSGKDTTTGHWEIAGLHIKEPFKTFPDGFPKEIMTRFEKAIGRGTLGNYAASGTAIIEELGAEHMATGKPIVYTSADSVFQVAAHESVISIDELYQMCVIAREIMRGDYALARIIARPFTGEPGSFSRTHRRKDYSLDPTGKTMLDYAAEAGYEVVAVGKIEDIFNGKGITHAVHTENNMDGIDQTLKMMEAFPTGLIFTNLVDFDMKYGHRRDSSGYRKALEEADARLPEILSRMLPHDLLIITADHGNDPTFKGSDHTREYVPILAAGDLVRKGTDLGTRRTFADISSTVSEVLKTKDTGVGSSFAAELFDKV